MPSQRTVSGQAYMSLLRPISIFLRNFLVKQHPYFSCCASCGEIKTPLDNRLCTSLEADFAIDAVLLYKDDGNREDVTGTVGTLRRHLPWLRRFICVTDLQIPQQDLPEQAICISPENVLAAGTRPEGSPELPPEALLHELGDLGDDYLVFTDRELPEKGMLPQDFFTPNGIPLIPASVLTGHTARALASASPLAFLKSHAAEALLSENPSPPAVYALNKESAAAFLPFFNELARPGCLGEKAHACYGALLEQWLFLSGRGIPVPRPTLL